MGQVVWLIYMLYEIAVQDSISIQISAPNSTQSFPPQYGGLTVALRELLNLYFVLQQKWSTDDALSSYKINPSAWIAKIVKTCKIQQHCVLLPILHLNPGRWSGFSTHVLSTSISNLKNFHWDRDKGPVDISSMSCLGQAKSFFGHEIWDWLIPNQHQQSIKSLVKSPHEYDPDGPGRIRVMGFEQRFGIGTGFLQCSWISLIDRRL